jgi:hypothetical protein
MRGGSVLRHTAFFMMREGSGDRERLLMQKGLAYLRFACPSVRSLDFGADLFGGSSALHEVKPWKRTPRWRGRLEGPPSAFDVALHLDFEDEAGLEAYNADDVHHEVAEYNASVCQGELTARMDWWYEGDPLIQRGRVRHSAMFVWGDEVDDATKEQTLADVRRLGDEAEVEAVTIGQNVGTLTTDFDWIVDVRLSDVEAAKRLIDGDAYAEVMKALALTTKFEWTARISHLMAGF